MENDIGSIKAEINRLINQYTSISGRIKSEKNAYLKAMETAPADEEKNPVLFSLVQEKQLEGVTVPDDLSKRDRSEYRKRLNYTFQSRAAEERSAVKQELRDRCAEFIEAIDYNRQIELYSGLIDSDMDAAMETYFEKLRLASFSYNTVDAETLGRYLDHLTEGGDSLSEKCVKHLVFGGNPPLNHIIRIINSQTTPELHDAAVLLKRARDKASVNVQALIKSHINDPDHCCFSNAYRVGQKYTLRYVLELLKRNPYFTAAAEDYIRNFETEIRVRNGLLDAIPATYPELFPLARSMMRHFVLHIGPTNSGKSYDAVNALKEAETGIYLAPLRLLAFEKFEELNMDGYPCTLKTGEEEIGIPFANLQSSTIEILDFTKKYDVAVIDEGQMIADGQRGSAWTFALLGVRADVVHVCLAPEAEDTIKSIITACGDSYEVVRHKRLVPLKFENDSPVEFPNKVERGTAFIVFSRKAVHAAAAELQRRGFKCSVIYGALPYDVRRNEVKRYVNGETDVVVATDAIGMGLNLPIKRIVFLETDKFDGTERRPLNQTEIKQIAGRAGRYQMFNIGLVTSEEFKHQVAKAIKAVIPQIPAARIGFPYSLLGIEGSLSQLMEKWGEIEAKPGFEGAYLSH
ncbi:MAG: hypothetical protein IKR93_00815 [Firmicutes bacterium]|nr:hypothetical protein [Bacillota bacterium]